MSRTHVTIVTGASRGLGHAITAQRLREGQRVLTLQRQPSPTLAGDLEQWACDLAEPVPVAARLRAWIAALPRDGTLASLALVNNAALLVDPGPLAQADAAQVAAAVRVGLEAPLVLTQAFLAASADLAVPRKVLNISSGLGRFAMAGSTVYCAVKAGIDHASRALALEEAARPHGAKIVSLAPGVIDTDMQLQLRSADAAAFPERERFAALREKGQLSSPAAAAAKVLACLDRADFGAQPVADVRDVA
jgi:NAD(P)-dependent dehydrogenase (short-subunit alcohol dehydrogenase family)